MRLVGLGVLWSFGVLIFRVRCGWLCLRRRGGGFSLRVATGVGGLGRLWGSGWGFGLADQFDVEDEVGLGRNHWRAAVLAVCELVGDVETAFATDMHALKAG